MEPLLHGGAQCDRKRLPSGFMAAARWSDAAAGYTEW